tara:strand:+ start:775 stop:1089 length:315 start_codon:yes stop_codon:yes gene_type:complete
MLFLIIKNIIISVVIIFLIHYIYDYLKNTLTIPKIKDLVNKPDIQYNEIINSIKETKLNEETEKIIHKKKEKKNMKAELQAYIEQLNQTSEPDANMDNTMFQSF